LVDYRSRKSHLARSEIHLARSRNSSCPLTKFILPAREIVKTLSKYFLKEASKLYLMPYSDDEEHSPSEFYYPDEISDETNDPNGRLEGENAEQNNKNSQEKIEEFIHNQKAKTTITKTKSDMKVFQRYLEVSTYRKQNLTTYSANLLSMSVKQMATNTNCLHCQVSREVYNDT
jgi:hypothetical protein